MATLVKRPYRRGMLTAFLWMAAVTGVASAAEQGRRGIVWKTLANGLDVIVIENHAVPLVTIEIAVKNGAYTVSLLQSQEHDRRPRGDPQDHAGADD